ncbi:MAG: cellulose-binding domain-containing protein, partial [Allobaculum sp.]|nr:cellulose-binding domain-containing protein [Allobaculum sp.]
MFKFKRTLSAIIGVAMTANMLATMPNLVFADSENSYNFDFDGYSIEYAITGGWSNTDTVAVTLTNTSSETIENWMLYFAPNGQIHNVVHAQEMTTSTGTAYFKNSGYNTDIKPDASVTFTYMVDDCKEIPNNFTLCQKRAEKESGYDVSIKVNETWGNDNEYFNGEIIIQNETNAPIEAWELIVDTNFTITEITNSWAANVTELEPFNYMLKGTYTGTISAGSCVSLGFNGMKEGEAVISDYSLTEVVVDEDTISNASYVGDYNISDLEELNKDSIYPLEIVEDEDGIVTSIDGKFSNALVTDEKSALESLYGVKKLLGMNDPLNELELDYIYESEISDYKSYFFNQVYDGIWVYGRNVTVVARDYGETMSLEADYVKITDFDINPVWSTADIENKYGSEDVELIIYTYDEYEETPILAYICDNDEEVLVISAFNGEQISVQNKVICEDYEDEVECDNEDLYDANGILYHKSGDFYTQPISNKDDAREVISAVDLNVDFSTENSLNTLSFANEQYTNYKTTYHFDQLYSGVRVFGREISVSAVNKTNNLISLDSNVVTISDDFNITPNFNKPNEDAELVIYTWDDNENDMAPKLAYIFDDLELSETIIVFEDETIHKPLGKGVDEGCY